MLKPTLLFNHQVIVGDLEKLPSWTLVTERQEKLRHVCNGLAGEFLKALAPVTIRADDHDRLALSRTVVLLKRL